jgi:CHASE1-domain containing sensor protein
MMMTKFDVPDERKSLTGVFPVLLILAALLAITLATWQFERKRIDQIGAIQFEKAIVDDAAELMRRHLQALRGGSGLYHASEAVSGAEWAQYVKDLDFSQNYPGIQGVSFNKYIRGEAELRAFEADI